MTYREVKAAQPPVILQPLSATGRFMLAGVSSRTLEPTELSLLVRWTSAWTLRHGNKKAPGKGE